MSSRQSSPPTDSFVQKYLQQQLNDFFNIPPGDTRQALQTPRTQDRTELVKALQNYATRLNAPEQTHQALELLAHEDSRAVVTGQQVGLLLGPTYSLAKAISAIKLARQLSTDAKPVVPVFWIASQDHDVEEIDHAYLLDMNEQLHRLEVALPAGMPAGKIAFQDAWLTQLLTELKTIASHDAHFEDVSTLLTNAAATASSFADWFAGILYQLLGSEGLIIINPTEPDVARLFAPVLRKELTQPIASSTAINDAADKLTALGESPQLGRAANATNLFLEEDTPYGLKRSLLRVDAKTFSSDYHTYTLEQLLEKLELDPTCITPAAGLRPVTQDAVLPTVATVVGPGELRYFTQIKGVYALHGIRMPLIWPRTTMTVIEPPVKRMLDKYDLTYALYMQDPGGHKQQAALKLSGHGAAFETALRSMDASVTQLLTHIQQIDPTLERTVRRGDESLRKTVRILEEKTARALREQGDITTRQFERLEQHLLPLGIPQERLVSPFSFFLKFGIHPVMALMLQADASGHFELFI